MINNTKELILQMVKDLENTSWTYHGYAYKRTMRNILIGNKNAYIAPCFTDKPYYGIFRSMTLQQVESMADELVASGRLSYVLTNRGRLYLSIPYQECA
jgi:hypothetical protein